LCKGDDVGAEGEPRCEMTNVGRMAIDRRTDDASDNSANADIVERVANSVILAL
jgi:hypothetical protein